MATNAQKLANITAGLNTRTLYWHPTGPLIQYDGDLLLIEDLNPHVKTQWRMSRAEMLRLGWRCILAALYRR